VQQVTIRPTPRYTMRGRPSPTAPPARLVYHIEGALVSSVAAREALVAQQCWVILATNEPDDQALSPRALLEGYKGQKRAERGLRFLKDRLLLASSLYLKKPQRIIALLMVMIVCRLVYAALEYRIRKAL
jgi:transposase